MPQFFKLTNQIDLQKLKSGDIDIHNVKLDDLDEQTIERPDGTTAFHGALACQSRVLRR